MKGKLLSIGDLSKRTSISEKTIRFYSNKNILVPDYINPKSNYRYYKPYQILKLKLINSLKDKGFTLKEIDEYIKDSQSQNVESFFQNHKKKLDEINSKIEKLEEVKKNIHSSMESFNVNLQDKISIKNFPQRNYINLDNDLLSDNPINTFQMLDSTIGNGYAHLGNKLSSKGSDVEESSILVFQDENNENSQILDKGVFLTISYTSDRDDALQKIINYADENNLLLKDEFYEIELINFFMTENKKEYIKEIQVPLCDEYEEVVTLKDGTYSSYGMGYSSEINIKVVILDNRIRNIKIFSHRETPIISNPSFEIIPQMIMQKNSLYIPNVSGSSYTSKGIKEAVKNALVQAGGDKRYLDFLFFKSNILPKIGWDINLSKDSDEVFDVVVIGGGAAGLMAAIEAKKQGKSVVILEKMPYLGGNTLLSLGMIIFPKTFNQGGISKLRSDMLTVGGGLNSIAVLDEFLNSLEGLEELLKSEFSLKLVDEGVFRYKDNEYIQKRITGKYGVDLISNLKGRAINLGVQIMTNSVCDDLIMADDTVRGVKVRIKGVEKKLLASDRVIITSGGFSQNIMLRKSFSPQLDFRYNCTNSSGNTGDGIVFSKKVGAKITHMEHIETVPYASCDSGNLSHMGYYIEDGAIIVNNSGKRFVREELNRNLLSEKILDQNGQHAYIIWDSSLEKQKNYILKHKDEVFRENLQKNFKSFETLDEVESYMGIKSKDLRETISNYNEYIERKEDPEFKRRNLKNKILTAPFYVLKVSPSVHYTNGGILINEKAQVLDQFNTPIKKLYAAGEVTAGLHGARCLKGTAISESLIFGKIAGENI